MTKSTITREESVQAVFDLKVGYRLGFADIEILKRVARMALAEKASEPVILYRERNPYNGLTTGWQELTENEFLFLKENAGENAEFLTLYRHAQPAPEYPEVLPCSVLLEPGLRFGKGIKTSTVLAALARRAVYESDMAELSPEERAEFQAGIEDFKALIAKPAPVVPAVSDDIGEIRVGRLPTMNQDDYPGLGDWWVQLRIGEDSDEVLARVYGATPQEANNRAEALACRAAMLQASPVCTCPSGDGSLRWPCPVHPGNSPAQSDCCPAQNVVSPAQSPIVHGYRPECECSGCKATARICTEMAVNSPANPGCWCRTCRPVDLNDMRFIVCPDCGNKRCPRANDHRNACTGSNEPGQEGSAYPDTPREVK
ncbi:hypothetical protein VBS39_08140 [Klebsiella pneumoniae]|nr:hypothetical protein [Klebsiella pneumoniae]MEA4304178.1 hypothetical protein [Klebsiella pneumoniae]MEA4319559.1 hypothetical protein [Klebsiella pneumoniae]MEA4340830.1 hypothetical protein [Klebsiella pneumoniae]MEA4376088.1 hypothetical protein [Klebsiella pneumoniae]